MTLGTGKSSKGREWSVKPRTRQRQAGRAEQGDAGYPPAQPPTLTEQVPAGDAPLGDGSFHGADGRGEDVGLLEDLGQLGSVEGAEGRGIVLLSALVELQGRQLIAPSLRIPVLVL